MHPNRSVSNLSAGKLKPKKEAQAAVWSVGKTFASLGLTLDDRTVATLFATGKRKHPWTKNKLVSRFDKLKESACEVHAEIQLILAAANHESTGAIKFGYVGCSKRSCFLCSRFIQAHNTFTTRGCHGKLYNRWTVPDFSCSGEEERLSLARILQLVERAMKECIKDRADGMIAHAQESSVGGSSVATRKQEISDPFLRSLVTQYLVSQQEEARANARIEGHHDAPE